MAPRTRLLLDGPVVPTLLRLAAPNVVVMVVQAVVSAGETYFLGWLGTDALAGASMVFPLAMLMQTMSAGGMGGGVASAVARALGGGRRGDADLIAGHALLIAVAMGVLFTVGLRLGGPALYAGMGGVGGALAAAVAYSGVLFSGAVLFWLFNLTAAVVRGAGNMMLPAAIVVGGAVITLSLSPSLIFGWGPLPALGIAGAAVAQLCYYGVGTLILLGYLVSGRGLVRLSLASLVPHRRFLADILRVGAPGALNTVLTNVTVIVLTGLAGVFGTAALAGYGLGARLEYLQIPIVFGFGSALVAMVGTNVGAGRLARAERIGWTGAAMAAGLTEAIGLVAALRPGAWLGLFSDDPAVLAVGTTYLHTVGPVYGFFGLGLALYFASQGAGRLLWPLVAGCLRVGLAAVGGWLVTRGLGGGPPALFGVIALALVCFGTTVAMAVKGGAWRRD